MGKIYKIVCNITGEVYVGSCNNQTLLHRLRRHKNNLDCSSKQIMQRGNYRIELIEEIDNKTKDELFWRERYWFERIDCINIYRPIVTKEEEKPKEKEYVIKSRPRINYLSVKRNAYKRSWSFNKYLGTGLCLLDIDPTLFEG